MSLDLRTGQPLWTIDGPNIAKHTKLTKDIRSEVVVVGGGISGALMAHKLADRGMEVTVADGRKIAAESRRRAPPSYRMKRTSI